MKQKELDFFTKKTNWEIQKNLIYKKYKFKNFILVKNFFNLIADESEKQNHHPKVVTLALRRNYIKIFCKHFLIINGQSEV